MAAVRVTIRVRPGASRTRVGGDHAGALVVTVGAPAVDGRATKAALAALAQALEVRDRDVVLIAGATSRTKVVDVEVPTDRVESVTQRLTALRTPGVS